MKDSNFDDNRDLVMCYRVMIESKKIDEEEVERIVKTYFKMVDELYRLKILSCSETVNEAISKVRITSGYDESRLKEELDELMKESK